MNKQNTLGRETKKINREFVKIIRKKLENHIKKIVLFGSYARCDFTEGSDYDIMVIVDKKEKFIQDSILDACVEIMNKYYELIACIVYDEKEWEIKKRFPLGLNILKEGIEL